MMARILLIKPPFYEALPPLPENFSDLEEERQDFYSFASQPSGLLRVGSYLKKKGNEVVFFDCAAEVGREHNFSVMNKRYVTKRRAGTTDTLVPIYHHGIGYDEFEIELKKLGNFDEIYVSSIMTYHWEAVHEIIRICRRVLPSAKIKLGGIYATICREHAKTSGAEVISGEIEEANDVWIDISLFHYKPSYMVLKSTRGCPNRCSYCAVSDLEGRCMRYRDPEDIVDEIETLWRVHGIEEFHFWESNLLVNAKKHFEKILDMIIERKIKIRFSTPEGLQPNLITAELAKKMKAAGMTNVNLPLETVDDDMSKNRFNRASHLSSFVKAVGYMRDAGFDQKDIKVFILAGMPEQGIESVIDSMIFVMELGLRIKIMPFTPIPGTAEYEKFKHLIKGKDLEDLHPFLFPFAGGDFDADDMIHLCCFNNNSYEDYFNTVTLLPDDSAVKGIVASKIRNSEKLWEMFLNTNPPWESDDNPDVSVVRAVDSGFFDGVKSVIDIGAGRGKNLRYLLGKGYDAFGIDMNRNVAGLLKDNRIVADVLEWKTDRVFDAAIDIGCFHMIKEHDQRRYIRKVHSLLKKHGRYVLRVFSEHGFHVKRFYTLSYGVPTRSPWIQYMGYEKIKALFSKHFNIKNLRKIMWCVVDGEMKPGMYELYMIRK